MLLEHIEDGLGCSIFFESDSLLFRSPEPGNIGSHGKFLRDSARHEKQNRRAENASPGFHILPVIIASHTRSSAILASPRAGVPINNSFTKNAWTSAQAFSASADIRRCYFIAPGQFRTTE
jgi:hypothetical protein